MTLPRILFTACSYYRGVGCVVLCPFLIRVFGGSGFGLDSKCQSRGPDHIAVPMRVQSVSSPTCEQGASASIRCPPMPGGSTIPTERTHAWRKLGSLGASN
ncbi:hypothetical protein VTK73DRAFT_8038 [Phialemonium thermophilum]|uniref:Secreted protein n=1 Tax=Phialemonium thermophilum TaxID=223376 RepID=A0ABR3WB43_9PEZI